MRPMAQTVEALRRHHIFTFYDLSEGVREPEGPAYLTLGSIKRVIATRGPYLPEVFRTPGYPLFLAGIYSVAGEKPLVAVFWQCVLAATTCLLFLLMSRSASSSL